MGPRILGNVLIGCMKIVKNRFKKNVGTTERRNKVLKMEREDERSEGEKDTNEEDNISELSNQFLPIQNYYSTMVIHFTYLNKHFVNFFKNNKTTIYIFFKFQQLPQLFPADPMGRRITELGENTWYTGIPISGGEFVSPS